MEFQGVPDEQPLAIDQPMSDTRSMDDAQNGTHQRARRQRPICRTCVRCRAKKVKCDGHRPKCRTCVAGSHPCTYPEDARKAGRLSKAEVEALQNEVIVYRNLLKSHPNGHQQLSASKHVPTERTTPNHRLEGERSHLESAPRQEPILNTARLASPRDEPCVEPSRSIRPVTLSPQFGGQEVSEVPDGPSTAETQIACAIDEDGSIQVHGVTSHLHISSTPRNNPMADFSTEPQQLLHTQVMKDQLFAFAALQRQHESVILGQLRRGINIKIELDGLPVELATHLLDLHWNRQHLAYLLTYRPAIFDSLTNNGPYANKLLLNAIYYSSCLYSDRIIFRSDPDDPATMGERFYNRFKELLVQELDRPSLATIVACLICGATLVSDGKQSAGWVLCGIAYRMIVDLGCHLSTSPQKDPKLLDSRLTATEIEIRTRIYWGSFVTDKFQSLYFGRQSALPPTDARVPRIFLDEYEELENWVPYTDPSTTPQDSTTSTYRQQPQYAVSTFQLHITLAEIAHAIASTFYTINSIRAERDQLLKRKQEIQLDLDDWMASVPQHLQFDEENDSPPPPNQITPYTTYYTLTILLERPFFSTGHLSSLADESSQSTNEAKCNNAAVRIWRVVDVYKRAHTLRRAPYLISYATYSAIVVLLNQTQNHASEYVNCIKFFWSALQDLQRGCNSGLGKPLRILQTLMNRLGQSIPTGNPAETYPTTQHHGAATQPQISTNTSAEKVVTQGCAIASQSIHRDTLDIDGMPQENLNNEIWQDNSWVDTMTYGQGLMDDSLFGLFTTDQQFMPGFDQNF